MKFPSIRPLSALVAAAAGVIIGVGTDYAWRQAMPATHWFDPSRVTVADAAEGEDPTLVVDRTIRLPFHGEWIVTVRRLEPGGFSTYCVGTGENDYTPGAVMTRPVFLSHWMGKACPLEPGQYRVDTRWLIKPTGYPPKERVVMSNLFRVTPRH